MGKGTLAAVFDPAALRALNHMRRPRTVVIRIHWAEAEQAVERFRPHSPVAWIILTIFIFKIFITVFHNCILYKLFRLPHQ